MDLSTLPPPVSEFDNQRTKACFTVRSANSPSYTLTCRPGERKPNCFLEEGQGAEEVERRERYTRMHTGTDSTTKGENHPVTGYQARTGSRSRVQCEEEETSGYGMSTELNQNGTAVKPITEFGTEINKTCNPGSESQGQTDWRRSNRASRSKSLNLGAGTSATDRGKLADIFVLPTKRGRDEPRTGIESLRARFVSSIQSHNSVGTSHVEKSPGSLVSRALERTSKGNSLPTRLRSLSGPCSIIRETTSSFGPKGGQSIMERIEKLYGSAGFSKTEDFSTIRDFTPATSHHRETTTDSLNSPQQRSYEWASGGTFPRRFSSEVKRSPSQSRTPFSLTQKDTPGSETSLLPQTTRTWERSSGVQGQGQTQGKYPEVGGLNGGRGFEEMSTRSLDRARSRYSTAAQVRSTRAAAGLTPSPHSKGFFEEERSVSLRDLSGLREGSGDGSMDQDGMKGETNGIRGTLTERKEQTDDVAKEKTESKSRFTDEDVFDPNPQNVTAKSMERKKFPERLSAASAASVRNKINQFEALTQRSHGLATGQALLPRRAFSAPTHLSWAHEGVQKSRSAKEIGGLRNKWEGLEEKREAGDGTEERVTGGRPKLGSYRSLSVDEIEQRLGRKEREGNYLVESEGKEMNSVNNCPDVSKYSNLKTTLDIPLNGGAKKKSRNFYIDEVDLYRTSSPEEASERPPSLRLSISAGVQKTTTPPRVASPVSDDDITPTNSPINSPFLTTTTEPENIIPTGKIPKQDSPLLPRALATSSHSDLPDLFSLEVNTALPNGRKQRLDLDAWVAGLKPNIMIWNDEDDDYDDDDDDESTQRDEDSNYDSDSGESSVTITSNMSQLDHKSFCVRWVLSYITFMIGIIPSHNFSNG
ncbi:uncharacterized protein LOC130213148 [Pseudoliparis swirei]|uniref:uncharacterized protein LOC130213148 n=1 Tax=Pseudoliparis swirei TaxID=2059687 RepID=UPI0024BD6E31|nr:uncharacterized protein LOC130213148 [Pseudoliparis swirei]